MRQSYWMALVAGLLLCSPVLANDKDMGKGHKFEPVKTRQEAIARVKERLTKLEAMSDEEWNKKHAERKQRREARAEKRKSRIEQKRESTREAAPSAGGATPATTPPVPEVVEKK